MALATLSIDLIAKLANLEQGLNRAADLAESNGKRMSLAFQFVAGAATGIATALLSTRTFDAFKGLITGAINAQDHLADLAKRTQLTVEQIGGIGFAASQAGANVDDASLALGKLNLTIAKAAAGDEKASELFKLIGVSAKDAAGNARDAGSVLVDVANKFASYADGPEKAALGNAIFGKSYQGIIPLLQDGGAALQTNIGYFERYSGVTAETAKAADQFNDSLVKVHLLQSAFGNSLAANLLPLLQTLVDRLIDSKEKSDLFSRAASGIASVLKFVAESAAYLVGTLDILSIKLDGVVQRAQAIGAAISKQTENATILDPFGSGKGRAKLLGDVHGELLGINTQVEADVEKARKTFQRFVQEINTPISNDYSNEGRNFRTQPGRAPKIPSGGTSAVAKQTSEIDNLIHRLTEQTIAELTAGEATNALEKAELELATNPKLAGASAAKRAEFLALADGLDKLRAKFDQASNEQTRFRLSEIAGTEGVNESLRQSTMAQQDAFHALIASTPTEAIKALNLELRELSEKFNAGAIGEQAFLEASKGLNEQIVSEFDKTLNDMQRLAVDGARGINDALGNTITDVLTGNFNDIGKQWERLLVDMAAKALQQNVAKYLFGETSNQGAGGLLSSIFPFLAGIGGRATGGSALSGSVNRVNESGLEMVSVQGKDYLLNGSGSTARVSQAGGAASTPSLVFNIAAGVQRSELLALLPQIKTQIKAEIVASMRRPGFA